MINAIILLKIATTWRKNKNVNTIRTQFYPNGYFYAVFH